MKTFAKTLLALSLSSLFAVPAYAQDTSATTQLQSGEAEGEQVMERTREQERLKSGTGEAKMSGDKPAYQHRNQVRNSDQGEQSGELVRERIQEEKRLQSKQDQKAKVQAKKQIRQENMFERQSGSSPMGGGGGGKR